MYQVVTFQHCQKTLVYYDKELASYALPIVNYTLCTLSS